MSQGNVDLIRMIFDLYERDRDRALSYLDAEVIWNPYEEEALQGPDAVRSYMDRWTAEWEGYSHEATNFVDAGDRVIVSVLFRGRGRVSGIETEATLFEVWTLRDGRVIRMDEFAERADALAAAGLPASGERS